MLKKYGLNWKKVKSVEDLPVEQSFLAALSITYILYNREETMMEVHEVWMDDEGQLRHNHEHATVTAPDFRAKDIEYFYIQNND